MSPEFSPLSPSEQAFTTPELPQECFDLYHKMSSQIMEWYSTAIGNHTDDRNLSMAGIINQDCAVDENGQPIDPDAVRKPADREERIAQEQRAERMKSIAPYANNPAIDGVPLNNHRAEDFFTLLAQRVSPDAKTHQEFESAFKKITRILKVREALAVRIDYTEYNNETTELIKEIAYRLVRDANTPPNTV